jgi:hypothetical protein
MHFSMRLLVLEVRTKELFSEPHNIASSSQVLAGVALRAQASDVVNRCSSLPKCVKFLPDICRTAPLDPAITQRCCLAHSAGGGHRDV